MGRQAATRVIFHRHASPRLLSAPPTSASNIKISIRRINNPRPKLHGLQAWKPEQTIVPKLQASERINDEQTRCSKASGSKFRKTHGQQRSQIHWGSLFQSQCPWQKDYGRSGQKLIDEGFWTWLGKWFIEDGQKTVWG